MRTHRLEEMSDAPHPSTELVSLNPIEPVYRIYAALAATLPLDSESGLGGKLLYAGEINPESRDLLYAANIAGAASLAASVDPAIQRQAIRDGVVDFLVTSLEEALRILKNEIRKHQTVSVCVAMQPEALVSQMLDRGVLPDLLPSGEIEEKFLIHGARQTGSPDVTQGEFVFWSVDSRFARWLPRLDTCALAVLPPADVLRRRWIRLAPRYLGRSAQKQHGVMLTTQEKALFESEVGQLLRNSSEETVNVAIFSENSEKSDTER
jgi:hypothetical protein